MMMARNNGANQRREHRCSLLEGGERGRVIAFLRPDWATVLISGDILGGCEEYFLGLLCPCGSYSELLSPELMRAS